MSVYEYSLNGTTWSDLGDAGCENLVRTRNNAETDFFSMELTSATAFTDAAGDFAYNTDIRIRQDSTQIFRGTVDTLPRQASGIDERQLISIAGPWRLLEKCTYQQTWKAWTGAAVGDIVKSRVILFQNAAGARITAGAQIEDAIDYAIAKGIGITKGTIDAGVELPTDERDNMSVAEVIRTVLRWFPDFVCWFDYSTATPTFHCRKRANLTAASKAITDGEASDIVAREDRQIPGIEISYEQTHDDDGTVYKTVTTDSAGTTTAFDTVYATFDLEGSRRTYVKQKVVTGDLPTPIELDGDKAFLKEMIPALAAIDDADLTLDDASFDVISLPARYLKDGNLPSWVDNDAETITFTWEITATIKNAATDTVEVVKGKTYKAQVTGTSASTRTYQRLTSFDAGETVPTGVAAALYASWNTIEYQGQFMFISDEPPGTIGPGNKFNLTSGVTAWASMNALVQTVTERIDEGMTTIQFGPPRALEADTLVALFRALRTRRYSWSRNTRATGTTDGAGEVEMGGASPVKTSSESKGERQKLRVRNTDGTNDHDIDLDPTAVAFADAGNQAAQAIKPREQIVIYDDAGTNRAKLAQVMASAPYGTELPIPIGLPANPASPATIGVTTEGLEAAASDTWVATAGAGVQVHQMTRVAYYDAGTETLYGYARTFKYDKHGRLASISAETRITIDVPEL